MTILIALISFFCGLFVMLFVVALCSAGRREDDVKEILLGAWDRIKEREGEIHADQL